MVRARPSGVLRSAAVALPLSVLCVQCGNCDPCPAITTSPCNAHDPTAVTLSTSPLQGFVDLHTHPMSTIGFAGKLVYGGIDDDAFLPVDPDCHENATASSPCQALGHCGSTHDGNIDNPTNTCGDNIRELAVTVLEAANGANVPPPDSKGYPDFDSWPKWNEVSHQIMWVDWIKRAYLGGLRVMVALAVNNKTLADVVQGTGGSDWLHPDDDKNSADQQINRLKEFVGRHSDWMGIATSADGMKQLVENGKLAVVLGLEVDNIGDFNGVTNLTEAAVHAEIQRLYDQDVRYLFPIHVIDNKFGTAAYYEDLFNVSNVLETHHFMNLVCSDAADEITQQAGWCGPLSTFADAFQIFDAKTEILALATRVYGMQESGAAPICPQCGTAPDGHAIGLVNRGIANAGLTPIGNFAILDMMRQGMMIDVDHMSEASTVDTLALALQEHYPVNSGHNVVRRGGGSERNLSPDGYAKIGLLHGMAGVGNAGTREKTWIGQYQDVISALGQSNAVAAFGTDANGVSPMMPPPDTDLPSLAYDDAFPQSGLGNHCWNYNTDGVAHYGLLADLVRALPAADGGAFVQGNLMKGAQYFYDTWKIAESYAHAHGSDAGGIVANVHPTSACAGPSCAEPRPACEPPSVVDSWGMCVRPEAAKPYVPTAPPADAMKDATVLQSGTYTLHLVAEGNGSASPHLHAQDVAVALSGAGRTVTLDVRAGADAEGSGGFSGERFYLRIRVADERLALMAVVPAGTSPDKVQGSFVSYAPGKPTGRGSFQLRHADRDARATDADTLRGVLTLFVESLRH